MDSESLFLYYARSIIDLDKPVLIYKELMQIFEEENMFQEQAGMLEKIYNLTLEPYLFEKIGDIALNKLDNNTLAMCAYTKYISLLNYNFYKNFKQVLEINKFKLPNILEENQNLELQILIDKYVVIVYMMIFLLRHKKIKTVLKLWNNIKYLKKKIEKINSNEEAIEDIDNSGMYLSHLLSEMKHHNEINKLAIYLCPENKKAYFNIISNLMLHNKYQEALDYYNDVFVQAFKTNMKFDAFPQLCWFLSDRCHQIRDFYSAVAWQKKAIEIELDSMGE